KRPHYSPVVRFFRAGWISQHPPFSSRREVWQRFVREWATSARGQKPRLWRHPARADSKARWDRSKSMARNQSFRPGLRWVAAHLGRPTRRSSLGSTNGVREEAASHTSRESELPIARRFPSGLQARDMARD